MRDTQTRRNRALGLVEKTILGIIAGASAAIGIVEIVFLVGRIARLAGDDRLVVAGIPVVDTAAPSLLEASARVVAAQYETVALTVDGLPPTVRAYLIAAAVLTSLLVVGICAAVAWLCLRVFIGRPFVASATWGIGIVSILVILASLGTSLFTGIAHAEIARFLGLGAEEGIMALAVAVDLAPLGWGLALAVVAGAFELGQRLQRDSDGLV